MASLRIEQSSTGDVEGKRLVVGGFTPEPGHTICTGGEKQVRFVLGAGGTEGGNEWQVQANNILINKVRKGCARSVT